MPMETTTVRAKIIGQIRHMLDHRVIKDRLFLDDEQLIRSEQLAVLEEIFNANVRDREIREISCHFAPVLENGHSCHLAIWGKTGTGKTLTISYLLRVFSQLCREKRISFRYEHLDLATPRPCFRALNDLACLLNASRRYKKGLSLEELMSRIETALAAYQGYLVLFIDEVDNVRRDRDAFLAFLVRRLPQRIPARLILIFASNRLNWTEQLDPRITSFLKLNELVFQPYHALDLQKILAVRVEKALFPGSVQGGVIAKVAALAGRNHGDARQAVALLARSAYLAEKAGSPVTLALVDQASQCLEQDKYLTMIRTAPPQLQLTLWSVLRASGGSQRHVTTTGATYAVYEQLCRENQTRALSARAFGDLIVELDMYTFIRSRISSRGRYGRTREIIVELSESLTEQLLHIIQDTLKGTGPPPA